MKFFFWFVIRCIIRFIIIINCLNSEYPLVSRLCCFKISSRSLPEYHSNKKGVYSFTLPNFLLTCIGKVNAICVAVARQT